MSATSQRDAELIAASSAFVELEKGFLALFYGPAKLHDDAERDAVDAASGREEAEEPFYRVLSGTPALTLEGMQAKARAIAASCPDLHTAGGPIVKSLLLDLIGDFNVIAEVKGAAP